MRHLLGAAGRSLSLPRYSREALRSVNALAMTAKTAYSWAHQITHELASARLIDLGPPITVIDAPATYRWWADHRKPARGFGFFVPDPVKALLLLDKAPVPLHMYDGEDLVSLTAMATTYYAENAYAGHLFPRRMDVYIPADLDYQAASLVEDGGFVFRARRLILEEAGGQLGGSNFRLIPAPYSLVRDERSVRKVGGKEIPVAPLPQVIVDLLQEGGSAAEAAELLIEREHHVANARVR
ncbi:MAG: hypothetical protein HY556_02520 [Euryarchaeota archaeon]|nr:hypothetical protein [Euryarchaeota archaeon]